MKNIEINIPLHPFNQKAINILLINVPKFANGFKPDQLNFNQKKQIYLQIKRMNHEGSNNTYNAFFEHIVSTLN